MTYICPYCNTEMILTGKGINKKFTFNENIGAYFYYCECGKKIVSKAFFNKDGTPKIFYDNIWRLKPDGSWWRWIENSSCCGNWNRCGYSLITNRWKGLPDKKIPKIKRFIFR